MKLLIVTNTHPDKINHIIDSFERRTDLNIKIEHQYLDTNKMTLVDKIRYKMKIPTDSHNVNQRIIYSVEEFKPDIVFIIKGNVIYPSTLKLIKKINPRIKLISWSLDDMYVWHNRSLFYTKGLKYYDLVFTTKSYNLEELKKLGAKNVKFLYQAYSKKYHVPSENCTKSKYCYDVLFIGAAEEERIASLNYLAENGIVVYIYGGAWDKSKFSNLHQNLVVHKYDLIGNDYAEALSCAKISLCFLRKANRDLHTSRSIEIPACRGFMLAEHTDEHLSLFEEDKEAVYFKTNDELLKKVQYYLKHEEERKQIRESGYNRSLISGYSYDDRVNYILKEVDKL